MSASVLIAIPCLLRGGTEIQTLNLVSILVGGGYRVTVCCYYEFIEEMVVEFRRIGTEVILMKLKRSDGLLRLIWRLRRLLNKLGPDIIHVQYLAPGLIPIISTRLAGVSTIFATVHQPGTAYGWKEKLLLRSAARLCTAFFCVSQSAEKSWFGDSALWSADLAKNGRKHFTIYNGVDCERIRATVDSVDANDLKSSLGIVGRPVVGVVGRLRKEKGHAWLLETMAEVVRLIPDVVLLVVGDGPDREGLKQKAENLGISRNVIWMGEKPIDEVYRLYSAMDVVAVPSLFEGFGLTAAEAMAAGRPVIASDVDGLREVVEDGITGIITPLGDSKALAGSLTKLLENPELRDEMGQRGHEVVEKKFSLERFQKVILSAYKHFTGMSGSL
jgi:glycosyltransferase involved in cell wall biosynthesis